MIPDNDDLQSERRLLKNRVRRRGIYLLPNMFTMAALFAGFYAIVQAMNMNFDSAAVAVFVAMVLDGLGYDPEPLRWLAWAVTVFAGLTMVSNVKYWSFKTINLKKSVPFVTVIVIAVVLALLAYQHAEVLFLGFVAYALSGYVIAAWSMLKRRRSAAL